VTLFASMFDGPMGQSIVGRARKAGLIEVGFVNPRDFAPGPHRKVDDRPYGGGSGMVMMAQPLYSAVKKVAKRGSHVVFMSAQGKRFDADAALRLSRKKHVVLVCGHYEGIDERVASVFDEEISIGDFILTGGELPAMVVADAVARLVPGVLSDEATANESFAAASGRGLDYPQYTRPAVWRGKKVPDVLLSGDHARIAAWRRAESLRRTKERRPDLVN
jgi:tRNA (guanine37-N1)-methyltransferase